MIKKLGMIAALGSFALLGACADYGGGMGFGGGGYGGAVALGDCGGFYDGFYGPIDDGCWGNDGGYWYRAHGEGRWRRDGARHFSHNQVASMHEMHPTGPGAGFHFHGGGGAPHGGGSPHGGGDHHG